MKRIGQRPTVGLIHVGGTIGMSLSDEGWVPDYGVLERFVAQLPVLKHPDVPHFEVLMPGPLVDSSNMGPRDWVRIAQTVVKHDAEYDGFVILHGTDTMAYTASALSFLLDGLQKPVILTGAQLSLEHVLSDGRDHILAALVLAGALDIPEVCIYFNHRLLRGNRSQKTSNDEFAAFESGNLAPLARVGARIKVERHLVRAHKQGPVRLNALVREPQVIAVRLFPGMTAHMLQTVLAEPTEGVVLETYGSGNFPSHDQALLYCLEEAVQRGVVVVNVSQCHRGRVKQGHYGTSTALERIGIISGADMTPEAALTKLYVLLARGLEPSEVAACMLRDLVGEISPERVEPGTPVIQALPAVL